ncbi:hypothetical protein [Nocardia sp. NPDC051750]|uniref:hypothetical protein n=1 Tax=Nocardia sp. NPDC051750 TaxID=3364325 RepID=UPI0037A51312
MGAYLGESTDGLVQDMIEVLTFRRAGLYGHHGALNRATRAMTTARYAEPEVV